MDSIRGVLGFVKTVEAGSFAGAARALGITPVAVSKNVARLERELGVRLLLRSTRQLSLTDEGRLFHERCSGPLQALQHAHAAVRDTRAAAAGVVRVTSVTPFGRHFVLPLLAEFSRDYPKVTVELDLDDTLADMIARRYDVGFRVGTPPDSRMVVREIAPLPFVVCAAPQYLAAHGTPRDVADLTRHNCLRLRSPRSGQALNWSLANNAPAVNGNLVVNELSALVMAALRGHGLVQAPLPLVLPLLRAGALQPLLRAQVTQGAMVYLHYPDRHHLPQRVRSFIDFMLGRLRANPDLHADVDAVFCAA